MARPLLSPKGRCSRGNLQRNNDEEKDLGEVLSIDSRWMETSSTYHVYDTRVSCDRNSSWRVDMPAIGGSLWRGERGKI